MGGSEAEDTEDEQMSFSDAEEQEVHRKNVYKMQLKKFEVFKSQNPKTGHFDVIFDLNGKYLYAHKFDLTVASETLKSWLSDPWRTTTDPIRINTYSFDIFYQLCCFLYSGGCILTNQNIFQIIDASEFFGIKLLKSYCKRFIENNEKEIIEGKDLFEMLDAAENYSLPSLKKYLKRHCLQKYDIKELLKNDRILEIKKSHLLSLLEAHKMRSYGDIEEKVFEAFVKWTENYVEKMKEETNEENFDVEEALENEFEEFLQYISFEIMNLEYLVEFLAKKPYLFSPSNLITFFNKFSGEVNERFKAVYHLAEAQALRKQKASIDKNFDLFEIIKCYMADVISATKFSELDLDFVVDFFGDKSFVFSCMHDLYKLYANCKRRDDQEEQLLKIMYEIAEREVSKKQAALLPDNNNIIQKAIIAELSEFLPNIKFHLMSKTFMMDFVVPKGICTFQQALNVYMLQVEIKNENNLIIGIFNDNFDILKIVGKDVIEVTSNHGLKQQFQNFKFPYPSEPSELKKKDGIEWYLCFEGDGILTVKHQSIITETDYLIAELKTINNGKSIVFKKKIKTSLKLNILNEELFEEIVELPKIQQPPQKSIEPQQQQQQQQQPPNQQEPPKPPIQTKRRSKNRRRRNTVQNINHHQNLHSYHPYIRTQNQQQQQLQVHQPQNQPFHQPFVQQIQQQIDQQFNNSPNYNIPFSPYSQQQHNYYPRFPGN